MLGMDWRKSTWSMGNGDCLEARWRKASGSFSNSNYAEVRVLAGTVDVRDSKDPGPALSFAPAAWRAFLAGVKAA